MLDLQYIRKNSKQVREATKNKGYDPDVVNKVLRLDKERRELKTETELLSAQQNKTTKQIKKIPTVEKLSYLVETKKSRRLRDLLTHATKIKEKRGKLKNKLAILEKDLNTLLLQIPNPPAEDVPIGKDESENKVLRKWAPPRGSARRGTPTRFSAKDGSASGRDFKPRDHLELGEILDVIDVKRAAKVSGTRFGYLKNEAVLLEFALVQYAIKRLTKEGFHPVIPPVLIKTKSMQGMGYLEHNGKNDMYVLEKDDIVLVGTSEQSIGPMYMDEVLSSEDLPRRYLGFSPCFRREAGSYGKDTRGIFRVHQFDKIEMFSFVRPEQGDDEHEFLLSIEEELFQTLGLPYQVVKMCTGDLGAPAARKYDIEVWIPSQDRYREMTSTSTTTDFQARRLNIRYKNGSKTEYVHMLNGTAFAIGRTIIAILENFQQKDGSVFVPKVLQEYVGKELIKPL